MVSTTDYIIDCDCFKFISNNAEIDLSIHLFVRQGPVVGERDMLILIARAFNSFQTIKEATQFSYYGFGSGPYQV